MTKDAYFFDTYAIIEIINGSPPYKPYANFGIIISKLNLFELYYTLRKMYNKEISLNYLHQYKQFIVEFDEQDIEAASELKLKNKRLSMADCIGYIVALRNNVKFLTGDKEFENMPNVEFAR